MINQDINPFQVLYVTDSPDPKAFVSLFSDYPIKFSLPIFQHGNVVLKGTQGAGKSMLLNLLRPEIRVAYHNAGAPFPVPASLRRFVAAGINLTLSGALDIGQRPLSGDVGQDEALFPLFFADFLNYYIVRDLLKSVQTIARSPQIFDGIADESKMDSFASTLAAHSCWFGYLNGVETFEHLSETIDRRLAGYRSFHQFNSDLPDAIRSTKTTIGTPLACAHDALKTSGLLDHSVPLFVRIDQLERLYRSDVLRPKLGREYRRIVNKAVGQRDTRVSYRLGTRRYAWDDDLVMYGTDDRLEHLRDYRIVDLEMRRKEDAKTWVFPDFAENAFRRRLEFAGYEVSTLPDPLTAAFGAGPSPEETAKQYGKSADSQMMLQLDKSWSQTWQDFLAQLCSENPFVAVLAAAWARQSGGGREKGDRRTKPPPTDSPWLKAIWKKERVRQCLMQIAARNRQRLRWAGKDAILGISAPNISVFLSVCHEIWDAFLRSEQRKPKEARTNPLVQGIHPDIQTVGIQTASQEWYEKIAEQPHGHDRQRFVEVMGRQFRTWLLDDLPMSNPGHLGFSLELDELRRFPHLQLFLQDAADYGDLYDADHTTKNQDRRPRKKWYLSPILSPYFQIPEAHPKEPRYTSAQEIALWLHEAEVDLEGLPTQVVPQGSKGVRKLERGQRSLFPNDEGEQTDV